MAHVQHPQIISIFQVTTNIVGKRPDADVGVRRHEGASHSIMIASPLSSTSVSASLNDAFVVRYSCVVVFRRRAAVQYAKQELRADARVHEEVDAFLRLRVDGELRRGTPSFSIERVPGRAALQ